MGPILGTILSAALSGIFGISGTIAQNKYNSPESQLKRLRKAGLPLAYMYGGKVAPQSEAPKMSIDPDFGAYEQGQLELEKNLNPQKLKNLQTEGGILEAEESLAKYDADYYLNRGFEGVDEFGQKVSGMNRDNYLDSIMAEKRAAAFVKVNEGKLKSIAAEVEGILNNEGVTTEERRQALNSVKQKIVNMLSHDKLMGQLYDVRALESTVNKSISDDIKDLPQWLQGFVNLLMKLMTKNSGGMSIPGIN